MAKTSEISNNVWLGLTPEAAMGNSESQPLGLAESFDLKIEATDMAGIPGPRQLATLNEKLAEGPQTMVFPSSGSVIASDHDRDAVDFVNAIRFLYYLANPEEPSAEEDANGHISMAQLSKKPQKILIHCNDGHTETSLLAVAYLMFAEGLLVHDAWIKLHREKQRNFFAYPSDILFLSSVQQRLLHDCPACTAALSIPRMPNHPPWFRYFDGSLPSRILPYLYLGNLTHANNRRLLEALGIRRILSIGEPVFWSVTDFNCFGKENVKFVSRVQDNGDDPLTDEFDRCLEIIRQSSLFHLPLYYHQPFC